MKRKMNTAAALFLPVLIWIIAITGALQAQYRGSNQPVTAASVHDSTNARVDTTRFKADSAKLYDSLAAHGKPLDSLKALWVIPGAGQGTTASTIAFEVLPLKSKGNLTATLDSQLVTFSHLKALTGDSLVEVRQAAQAVAQDTFDVKIRDVAGLARADTLKADIMLQADSTVSPSGKFYFKNKIQVADSVIAAIFKVTGEYSLPPRDTTAGLIPASGGAGQPWTWVTDQTTAWGGADTTAVQGIAAGMIGDSLEAHPYRGASYIIGRDSLSNYALVGADSANCAAALQAGFIALASTGGTIYVAGGVYAMDKTDSIPSTTKRISIVGERGRTQVYIATADYAFYDTLNTGKIELGGGIEWIGTANALGLIRTGVTAATSGDTVLVRDNIIRAFSNASAKVFAQDSLTNGWLVEDNLFEGNTSTFLKGYNNLVWHNRNYGATVFGFESSWFNLIIQNEIVGADSVAIQAQPGLHAAAQGRVVHGGVIQGNTIAWNDSSNYIGIQIIGVASGSGDYGLSVTDNKIGQSLEIPYYTNISPVFAYGILYAGTTTPGALEFSRNTIIGSSVMGIQFTLTGAGVRGFNTRFSANNLYGLGTGIYYDDTPHATASSGCVFAHNTYQQFTTGLNINDARDAVVAGEIMNNCTATLTDGADGTITDFTTGVYQSD